MLFIVTGAQNLLCDFHREQAWERWVKKKDHGVSHLMGKDGDVLPKLRRIARKPEDYAREVLNLKSTDEWKTNQSLSRWFSNTWLKNYRVVNIIFNILLGIIL